MNTTPPRKQESFDTSTSTSSSSQQGAVGPKETRLRLLLQAEVKLLSDMKEALEEDLMATKSKLRIKSCST